jgi:hypothetical protein
MDMRKSPAASTFVAVLIVTAFICSSARAEFTPPKDGKLTEKQVTNYIDVKRDQFKALKAAGVAANGTQSTAANLAIYTKLQEKLDAAVTAHGMTKEEYNWVDGEVGKLWMTAVWQCQWDEHGKPDIEKQIKTKEAERDAAKAKLATYEQAQKDGKRVLTKEQRDSSVQSATSDRDSIASEVKDRENDLKAAKDEVATHEKEAKDADNLAKNPPADVSADDRQGYIDGKKGEAQTARDAAKDSQTKVAYAQKALDDAKARLAAADGKVKNPDMPVTDDEKAQVKDENQKAIDEAKATIDGDEQGIAALKETLSGGSPMLAQLMQDPKEKPDPDNLALVRKHIREYLTAMDLQKMLDAQ